MNVEQEMTDHIGNKWGYKWLKKNLENVRGKPLIDSQEKTAVVQTAHKRRKVMQSGT